MSKTVENMQCYAVEERVNEHFDGPLGDIDSPLGDIDSPLGDIVPAGAVRDFLQSLLI